MTVSKSPKYFRLIILFLLSLCGYGLMAYGIGRSNFTALIALFGVLFIGYYLAVRWVDTSRQLACAIGAAVLFRLVLLFALPNLSDDFYRYIWDGNLFVNGLNPFAYTPEFYFQNGLPEFLSPGLYENLNSQSYYTVYPPVSQFIYALSAGLFGTQLLGNVVVMKAVMLAAEIGTICILKKLLDHFGLSPRWLLVYALNPLIILELTGNLHFEGVMIFFLLAGYYAWLKGKLWVAAGCFVLAVNTKLIPLLILPYLLFSIGWRRGAALVAVTASGTLLLHLPFLDSSFIGNFSNSLGLYFQSFEFNASIYYVVRWVGFQVEGYNIIQTAAPRLALLSTVIILLVSWRNRKSSLRNLPVICILVFGIYYLFSTTVHPWYIGTLVAFAPLAGWSFPVIWSAVIPLTYATYTTSAYSENLWFVALEYAIVLIAIWYDWKQLKEPVVYKNRRIFGYVPSFEE